MNLVRRLDAADTYIELFRKDPGPQFEKVKKDNPYGFDISESSPVWCSTVVVNPNPAE